MDEDTAAQLPLYRTTTGMDRAPISNAGELVRHFGQPMFHSCAVAGCSSTVALWQHTHPL
jgi:hypothetical protein